MSKNLEEMRVGATWIYGGRAFQAEEPASAKALGSVGLLCSETGREPVSLELSEQEREREREVREVRLKEAKGLSQGHTASR